MLRIRKAISYLNSFLGFLLAKYWIKELKYKTSNKENSWFHGSFILKTKVPEFLFYFGFAESGMLENGNSKLKVVEG